MATFRGLPLPGSMTMVSKQELCLLAKLTLKVYGFLLDVDVESEAWWFVMVLIKVYQHLDPTSKVWTSFVWFV